MFRRVKTISCDVCRSVDDVKEPVKGMLDQRRLCGDCRGLLAIVYEEKGKTDSWPRSVSGKPPVSSPTRLEDWKFDHKSIQTCKHNATPFTFQSDGTNYTLYLSAHRNRTKEPANKITAGLYLDPAWVKGTFFRADGSKPYKRMRMAFLNWPDFGVVHPQTLREACEWAEFRLKGGERLEVGCVGGHGRTGTMTASLMVYMGWSALEAIAKIRKDYCGESVETKAQEELVKEMEKWRRLT